MTTGLRILVTGGRHFADRDMTFRALDAIHRKRGISLIAHGATPTGEGADWHADAWGKARGVPVKPYPVVHLIDGPWPGAGPKRNARMLADFGPDGVVAMPGERGTASMIELACAAGVTVWEPAAPKVMLEYDAATLDGIYGGPRLTYRETGVAYPQAPGRVKLPADPVPDFAGAKGT